MTKAGRDDVPKTDRGWQAWLSNVRAPDKRLEVSMGGALSVWLETSGAKRFEARIRRRGDTNPRRIEIGSFPATTVGEARRKLLAVKAIAAEGRDPALETRRARAGVDEPRTVLGLVAVYLARRAEIVAPKTVKIDRDLLLGVLVPALGDRLLSDLEPRDFGRLIESYAARLKKEGRSAGANANALLKVSRHMFKAARGWGIYNREDPTRGLTKPVREAPRDRILFDGRVLVGPTNAKNEIGSLVAALLAEPSRVPASRATRIALMLAITMGFRALEVCSLEWASVDLESENPSLTVTNSKTKAGRRTLPLTAFGCDLMMELKAHAGTKARFVFPAAEEGARVEHLNPESLSRAFARACQRLRIEGATLHDLRRTCLSGLIELGHESVAERIAGHVPRHVLGRHYDRSARLGPMRQALVAWATAVLDAAELHAGAVQV